ncbi:MAG: hypothetical protein IPH35_01425 [Rhodoferax sp.]|nr:hypothetical protein [Rhodoferax sp.]
MPRLGRAYTYALEPYVMAADVDGAAPYQGQGGWSWYTGAAGLMQRAVIESIFGLQQQATTLCLTPCLPSHWNEAQLTLRRDGNSLHFILLRTRADAAPEAARLRTARAQPRIIAGLARAARRNTLSVPLPLA